MFHFRGTCNFLSILEAEGEEINKKERKRSVKAFPEKIRERGKWG